MAKGVLETNQGMTLTRKIDGASHRVYCVTSAIFELGVKTPETDQNAVCDF